MLNRRLKVAFFTLGRIGSGSIVIGLSLINGLRRAGMQCDYTIVSDNKFHHITDGYCDHILIDYPVEALLRYDTTTPLYDALVSLRPDILIINQMWLQMYPILDDFDCLKVFMCRMAPDKWWHVPIPENPIVFSSDPYDLAYSLEPGYGYPGLKLVNPIVIRNRDEVLDESDACGILGKKPGEKLCVVAHNGGPGELDQLEQETLDLRDEYRVVAMDNSREDGIFPLVDCVSGIDFFVSGAGYNAFYEARYFKIPSRFTSFARNAEDQQWRIDTNSGFEFDVNGADQISADILELVS